MVAILLAASDLNQRGVMRWLGPRAGKVQVLIYFGVRHLQMIFGG